MADSISKRFACIGKFTAFPDARAGSRIANRAILTPVIFEIRRDIQRFTQRRNHGIARGIFHPIADDQSARRFFRRIQKSWDVVRCVLAVAVQEAEPI